MSDHTFVVLAHGDSPYLEQCLVSLATQTLPSTIKVATSTPSGHIRRLSDRFEAPLGVAEAGHGIAYDWNYGLQLADTPFVTLAHQDDIYLPHYTERCLEAAKAFSDTLICFPDYAEIQDGVVRPMNRLLRIKQIMLRANMPFGHSVNSRWRKKALIGLGSPIPAPGVVYNLRRLSDFRFSSDFSINMDWDAWFRMTETAGRFVHVPEVLLQHRIHADSATTAGLRANLRQAEDLRMFRRLWPSPLARMIACLYAGSYQSNRH